MHLPLELLRTLEDASPQDAWSALFGHAWDICSAPIGTRKPTSIIPERDALLAPADLFLATAGWDLWRSFEAVVPRTSQELRDWWTGRPAGRAVLLLDALSLRETPWILQGATERGYAIEQARPTGAELPPDTDQFAWALGLASRSSLQSNAGGGKSAFAGARTESTRLPWEDCADQVNPSPDWFFWHSWLDDRVHELKGAGQGLVELTTEAERELTSDGFWKLVERLSTGRRLVITADHGYAASGQFSDTPDVPQTDYLKGRFKSGRSATSASPGGSVAGNWVPPLDLQLTTMHGDHVFALGRRKWKSAGGYPTLTHGGLSLLEVVVPFIELTRPGGV